MRQIPRRRGIQRPICYLEQEEVDAILAQPDRSTLEGQGDHTLLVFLYNTGARIQEALDLCPQARSRARRTPPMIDVSEGSLGMSGGHRLSERRSLYDEGSRHAVRTVLHQHRLPIRTRRRH